MQSQSRYRQEKKYPRSRIGSIVRRFFAENMVQTSAALAFTTLMALVPLVAVILSVAEAIPFLDLLISRLDLLVRDALLPSGVAGTVAGNIGRFSHKAQGLTVAGIAVLGITALLLLNTIERTFNHLWQVKPRPLLRRLKLYAFVMAIWPFVLGAIAGAISFAVTVSLGFVDESLEFRKYVFKGVSILLLGMFFTFLYYAVPNANVPRRAALTGGLFATLAFSGMQKIFELYLVKSALIKSVYGAFAAFPVFLVWLHLSWVVVLLGGLIAATLSRPVQR